MSPTAPTLPAAEYLADPVRQVDGLGETAHRPWPVQRGLWLMGQTWRDLLFAHWRADPDAVRAHVPEPLELDLADGTAWVGVTPFVVTGFRLAATPPLPWLSTFPELNVRTYVTYGGKPGIWFFSLDAASSAAVAGARRLYRLPYFLADMTVERDGEEVRYASRRIDRRGHEAAFSGAYGPTGPERTPPPGSLEAFLTERYCLYAQDPGGGLLRAEIHHPAWRLRDAEADLDAGRMPPPGLALDDGPALLHLAHRQDVVIWRPRPA